MTAFKIALTTLLLTWAVIGVAIYWYDSQPDPFILDR